MFITLSKGWIFKFLTWKLKLYFQIAFQRCGINFSMFSAMTGPPVCEVASRKHQCYRTSLILLIHWEESGVSLCFSVGKTL